MKDAPFDVLARIEELRRINDNMSVYRLSQLSGISQSTISTWYKKNHYPPIDKIEILCRVFGISLAEFFYVPGEGEEAITFEDMQFLKSWHRLTAYNKRLVHSITDGLGPR